MPFVFLVLFHVRHASLNLCSYVLAWQEHSQLKTTAGNLKKLHVYFLCKKADFFFCVTERHWQTLLTVVIRIILHVSEILSVWQDRIYNPLYPLCFSTDILEMCTQKTPVLPCFSPENSSTIFMVILLMISQKNLC